MKLKEEKARFRSLSVEELKETIQSAREELMNFRFRRASGQLPSPAVIMTTRRRIARAETVLQQKIKG